MCHLSRNRWQRFFHDEEFAPEINSESAIDFRDRFEVLAKTLFEELGRLDIWRENRPEMVQRNADGLPSANGGQAIRQPRIEVHASR